MSLVDYASSDEENENEHEVDRQETVQIKVNHVKTNATRAADGDQNFQCDADGELFSSLPKPKKTFSFPEDNNLSKLLLNKNNLTAGKKESVQISVPSVTEYDSDSEQPVAKKIKPSAKGAGLFSILPPPKNAAVKHTNTHLVPHAVSKNQIKQTAHKGETNNKVVNSAPARGAEDEEDDDIPVGSSFFGSSLEQQNLHSHSEAVGSQPMLISENPNGFEANSRNSFENEMRSSEQKPDSYLALNVEEDNLCSSYGESAQTVETANASDNPLELDEKALQILCGNKKKRQQMPMNIIDLSGEEILPDSKEWLLKQFTEEKRGRSHSHKKTHGPSSLSRRKHQITYLAYQAKEQELELQNQWANNRMSRKQTQSKYGF